MRGTATGTEARGGGGFSRGPLGPADPPMRGQEGHATVVLTMGFLLSPP